MAKPTMKKHQHQWRTRVAAFSSNILNILVTFFDRGWFCEERFKEIGKAGISKEEEGETNWDC